MFDNVLVAFDGSDLSVKALEMGRDLCELSGGKLHVMHVNLVAASLLSQAKGSPALQEMLDTAGDKVEAQAKEALSDAKCEYEVIVIDAPAPAKPLNEYANRHDIDLIIMGSRGLGTMKQYFGSVAHALLNITKVPTTIIKG